MNLTSRFIHHVERLRKKQAMSQDQLGQRMIPPLSQPGVAHYMRGRPSPNLRTVERFATALGVDPLSLLKKIPKKS